MKDNYVHPRGDAPGMELRDWFAGMALSGITNGYYSKEQQHLEFEEYARISYRLADAMIYRRSEENI